MTSIYSQVGIGTLDAMFDPDAVGDGPVATLYTDTGGVTVKYAALKYGTQRANTGFRIASGADFASLWASKGTANYALSINGNTYGSLSQSGTTASSSSTTFSCSNTSWTVRGISSSSGATPSASGAVPSGATAVQFTMTAVTSNGTGNFTNGAPAKTNLTAGLLSASVSANSTPSTGESDRFYNLQIVFYNSAGSAISTTTIQLRASAVGAA